MNSIDHIEDGSGGLKLLGRLVLSSEVNGFVTSLIYQEPD
jgi:hypothetical protein